MTEHHPYSPVGDSADRRDYLPAAGLHALLPGYDLLTRLLGMRKNYDNLVAQAELVDGLRVLEIGCGTGNVTILAKRRQPGAELVGIDPDPKALARAQRKALGLTGIHFDRGYAQSLPFADGEFDRVLSSMMLHHLDDETKAAAAAEVFRVLRPGGRLHILDVGGHMTAADGFAARRMLGNAHAAGNLGDAIPRLLVDAGFDCREVATQRHRFIGRLTFYCATRPGA
ncbi:class I SAM-dependent methyltransferase [Mycolicibacterium stellerae]|uniref:class I SAM-dependent methyltransferase n=1 Tax=Mycolicibacterium stellerae TaxID=2358193 RepID=UPI000F0BC98D|nr:class I SAM-dependent methyltransferase [Mycolicibacterium stellerae]